MSDVDSRQVEGRLWRAEVKCCSAQYREGRAPFMGYCV